MSAYIHRISTRAPSWAYEQSYIRDRMKNWSTDPKTKRLIHAIYNRSGIETRHSVLGDFVEGEEAAIYRTDTDGLVISPGTAERNAVYAHASRELAVKVSQQVLDDAPGFSRADVTHVVFASCTGFANPGPDYHIIRELGLRNDVQRYTLGFMGCYAAFPALRMAAQFCEADPSAVALRIRSPAFSSSGASWGSAGISGSNWCGASHCWIISEFMCEILRLLCQLYKWRWSAYLIAGLNADKMIAG